MFKRTLLVFSIIFSLFILAPNVLAKPATANDSSVTLINPLAKTISSDKPVQTLAARLINTMFGIAGSVALFMFVLGGFLWMFAGVNKDFVKKGKDIFVYSSLGLIIMFSSYVLVQYLFTSLLTQTAGAPGDDTGGIALNSPSQSDLNNATVLCCIDYAAQTAKTISKASDCPSGATAYPNLSCDDAGTKFCATGPQYGSKCEPTAQDVTCKDNSKSYTKFVDCLKTEGGAGTGPACTECTQIKGLCKKVDSCGSGFTTLTGACGGEGTVCCVPLQKKTKKKSTECARLAGDIGTCKSKSSGCDGGDFYSGLCGKGSKSCCIKYDKAQCPASVPVAATSGDKGNPAPPADCCFSYNDTSFGGVNPTNDAEKAECADNETAYSDTTCKDLTVCYVDGGVDESGALYPPRCDAVPDIEENITDACSKNSKGSYLNFGPLTGAGGYCCAALTMGKGSADVKNIDQALIDKCKSSYSACSGNSDPLTCLKNALK